MISTTQSQWKSLEKKIKNKSESVANYLKSLMKHGTTKDCDRFENDKLNECFVEQKELSDILTIEMQEDGRINENIQNTSKLRELLKCNQAIIDKCLKGSTTQRNEHQIKMFDEVSKNYDEFLSKIIQVKKQSQEEHARLQEEIHDTEYEIPKIDQKCLDAEMEMSALEQTDADINLELKQDEKQMELHKMEEQELVKIRAELNSYAKELQEKNHFAAEQENSIADINNSKKELIHKCEEFTEKKNKLQDDLQSLEMELDEFSTLLSQVTNKAEIFQLESDDKFLHILESEEYLESKSKLKSILNDNETMMKELQLLHENDESITTSINETKNELKLFEEELAEMEMKKQSFENELHQENESLQKELLKAQSEDQKMIQLIQQLNNEAENFRMEELYAQELFSSNKIQWNQKLKEENHKLNELKRNASSIDINSSLRDEESDIRLNIHRPRSQTSSRSSSNSKNKRKAINSPVTKSVKKIKQDTTSNDSTLIEDSDDDENNILQSIDWLTNKNPS
ncbi:unnamed protein product [Diamesa serratosioi]